MSFFGVLYVFIKIEVTNFRNYQSEKVKLCDKINIFIGNNAQGKTNILESIYILALTKSHRMGLENNIIKNQANFCRIQGMLRDENFLKELKIELTEDKKRVFINKNEIKKIASYISNMNVIMFSPSDLDIIKGSPQIRRNLLNIQISQLYPFYVNYLNEYNKLLKNRNEYLKQLSVNGFSDTRYLDIINEKLVDRGVQIYLYRKKYLDYINTKIENIFFEIAGVRNLNIVYENNLDLVEFNSENIREKYLSKLKNNIKREIAQGMTLYGPHRDDFSFYINNENMKYYASQGQQRLAIIAFKLVEVSFFRLEKGTSPILLLDDIFSELDITKRNKLIEFIPKDVQTIITTTDLKNIQKRVINRAKVFIVDHGKITEKVE